MRFSIKKKIQGHNPKLQADNFHIYNHRNWRGPNGLRKQRLFLSPYCCVCGKPGQMVDHIIPINAGGDPWDLDNTQTMCNQDHAIKRASERKIYKQ